MKPKFPIIAILVATLIGFATPGASYVMPKGKDATAALIASLIAGRTLIGEDSEAGTSAYFGPDGSFTSVGKDQIGLGKWYVQRNGTRMCHITDWYTKYPGKPLEITKKLKNCWTFRVAEDGGIWWAYFRSPEWYPFPARQFRKGDIHKSKRAKMRKKLGV